MVNLFNKFVVLLLSLAFISYSNTIATQSSTLLFYDDFNDNDVSDWFVPRQPCSGGPWQVSNGNYGILNPGCVTESIPNTLIINSGVSYRFEVDMYMVDSILKDRNFVFKYKDSQNWYGVHVYGNYVYLQKVVNGIEIGSPFSTNIYTDINPQGFSANTSYHFAIDIYEDKYILSVDDIAFPTIFDNSIYKFDNYSAGLQASGGDSVWFDNVKVTLISDVTPTPLATSTPIVTATPTVLPTTTPTAVPTATPTIEPTVTPTVTASASATPILPVLSVPSLKQYSVPWKNKIYDHTKNTIHELGCALTSAVMVLQYHGHNIMPDALNTWLNNEKDGYIRNGLINWLAVSRYSKLHDSVNSPTLEYKRLEPTNTNLDNELNNNRPAILKENGHFVVATGKTNDTYLINDPGYATRDTLESYGNTYLAINSYTPTHSDLSYMMFVVDHDVNVEILDSNGNTINIESYIDEPIKNLLKPNNKNGEKVKTVLFEKPTNGKYTLKVSGAKGNYQLDSYLYDTNGKLTINKFDGNIKNNDIDTFNISFEGKNKINEKEKYRDYKHWYFKFWKYFWDRH